MVNTRFLWSTLVLVTICVSPVKAVCPQGNNPVMGDNDQPLPYSDDNCDAAGAWDPDVNYVVCCKPICPLDGQEAQKTIQGENFCWILDHIMVDPNWIDGDCPKDHTCTYIEWGSMAVCCPDSDSGLPAPPGRGRLTYGYIPPRTIPPPRSVCPQGNRPETDRNGTPTPCLYETCDGICTFVPGVIYQVCCKPRCGTNGVLSTRASDDAYPCFDFFGSSSRCTGRRAPKCTFLHEYGKGVCCPLDFAPPRPSGPSDFVAPPPPPRPRPPTFSDFAPLSTLTTTRPPPPSDFAPPPTPPQVPLRDRLQEHNNKLKEHHKKVQKEIKDKLSDHHKKVQQKLRDHHKKVQQKIKDHYKRNY